jgi:FAD/FMN-containing dehydrogenase
MEAKMADLSVTNWGGAIRHEPRVVVRPRTVEEIVAIVKDTDRHPSPIRAIGSNHSTTRCGVADSGTIVDLSGMDRILAIGPDTVTVQAGALQLDVALELERHGLQFAVNVEIGNMTLGSGACGATKDASMPGEFGQVNSYAVGVKLVLANGELLEVTEEEESLLQVVRSSFGLLGILYEVTYRVHRLQPMRVSHTTYTTDEFARKLPEIISTRGARESMMLYLFPFLDRISVEYRSYAEGNHFSGRWVWQLRNWTWKTFAPGFAWFLGHAVPWPRVRFFLIDRLNQVLLLLLGLVIRGSATSPAAQTIRYPEVAGRSKYTFSIWAFSEERYPEVLREYFAFCRSYYQETGFRCDMLNVGYRIAADRSSLFSYSWDGTVLTLDPVSTGAEGWDDFLRAYNDFCSERGGVPLFNQTKWITADHARQAFGERLGILRQHRDHYDPEGRFLNEYFEARIQ